MRKDKIKVTDEIWDDARIESFLAPLPSGITDPDYQMLLRAYRGMRAEDFERFMVCYVASGRPVDARSDAGTTLRDELRLHHKAGPYLAVLDQNAPSTRE